ncbi:MAG: dipeptide epimerase [Verrucomicrobia bacterium]|nr:dipeptide epimerase [Verrucomicrobiota bacterium]
MQLTVRRYQLKLAHAWKIASRLGPGGGNGADSFEVALVQLRDADGVVGLGEAAPSTRYAEDVDSCVAFLARVNAARLSFSDVPASMAYLDSISTGDFAPKCALNLALLDGAAHRAGRRVCDLLGLGFNEGVHVTSYSIGIDAPDVIRAKVLEAAQYPVLKLKVGVPGDRENLKALRDAAPAKRVRVDANEGWATKEEALRNLEWLATDGHIEFCEQPLHARSPAADFKWLKARTPVPIMADESYLSAKDAALCAGCFHAVNVKLVKTAGITGAHEALVAARAAGLKTMIGCMIETSVLITAAAHLAELTDFLDIDGNLLTTNDPFRGATAEKGVISLATAPVQAGLCVRPSF